MTPIPDRFTQSGAASFQPRSDEERDANQRMFHARRKESRQAALDKAARDAAKRAQDGPTEVELSEIEKRANALLELNAVPKMYRHAILPGPGPGRGNYDRTVADLARMVDSPEIIVLCGAGSYRLGKSHLACATVNHFCTLGKSAMYTTTIDFLIELQSARSFAAKRTQKEVVESFWKPDLLVLDEIQVRGETAFDDAAFRSLIDHRHADLKSTLLIGNIARASLSDILEPAIVARINERGTAIEATWPKWWMSQPRVAA